MLLYAYDVSAGERHDRARDLVARLGREHRGALSIQVLQEFYVNATKKVQRPMSRIAARDRVRTLSHWATHSPLPNDVLAAAELADQHTISFWGAMVIRSASELDCAVLWTEDLDAGQRIDGVQITNPFAGAALG